jgi:hypothetical protein
VREKTPNLHDHNGSSESGRSVLLVGTTEPMMTHGDEQVRKNAGDNHADENNGSAPKPKTWVTITNVTRRDTGLGIVGVTLPDGDETRMTTRRPDCADVAVADRNDWSLPNFLSASIASEVCSFYWHDSNI